MNLIHLPKIRYKWLSNWLNISEIKQLLENLPLINWIPNYSEESPQKEPYYLYFGDNLYGLNGLTSDHRDSFAFAFFDPPYNSNHDFIINDFENEKVSFWTQGTSHRKWIRMLLSRLILTHKLLHPEYGVLLFCIDDKEIHNARMLLDAIFGEYNFLGTIIWQSLADVKSNAFFTFNHTYLILYAKDKDKFKKLYLNSCNDSMINTPFNFPSIWKDLPTSIDARNQLENELERHNYRDLIRYFNPKPNELFIKLFTHLFAPPFPEESIKILDPFAGTGSLLCSLSQFNNHRSVPIQYFGCQYPLPLRFLSNKKSQKINSNLKITDLVKSRISSYLIEQDTHIFEAEMKR